jgi:Phage integrase family
LDGLLQRTLGIKLQLERFKVDCVPGALSRPASSFFSLRAASLGVIGLGRAQTKRKMTLVGGWRQRVLGLPWRDSDGRRSGALPQVVTKLPGVTGTVISLRLSEACDLRWDNIDLRNRTIIVRRLKCGTDSVHYLERGEMNGLKLQRQQQSEGIKAAHVSSTSAASLSAAWAMLA